MGHITFPNPSEKEWNVGTDHHSLLLSESALSRHDGKHFMILRNIAKYWVHDHGAGTFAEDWRPIWDRIERELQRRLEVGRVKDVKMGLDAWDDIIDISSLRYRHGLRYHLKKDFGEITYGDVCRLSEEELLHFVPNFGKKSIAALKVLLAKRDLHLGKI